MCGQNTVLPNLIICFKDLMGEYIQEFRIFKPAMVHTSKKWYTLRFTFFSMCGHLQGLVFLSVDSVFLILTSRRLFSVLRKIIYEKSESHQKYPCYWNILEGKQALYACESPYFLIPMLTTHIIIVMVKS